MHRLFVVVLVACGARTSTPAHPDRGSAAAGEGSAGVAVAEASPSDADCGALIAHAVALAAADKPAATDDDRTRAGGELHAQYAASCRAMSHADYLCALSAPSLASLGECGHATRSSSTSNSSVAPGGMTPAAPRSP